VFAHPACNWDDPAPPAPAGRAGKAGLGRADGRVAGLGEGASSAGRGHPQRPPSGRPVSQAVVRPCRARRFSLGPSRRSATVALLVMTCHRYVGWLLPRALGGTVQVTAAVPHGRDSIARSTATAYPRLPRPAPRDGPAKQSCRSKAGWVPFPEADGPLVRSTEVHVGVRRSVASQPWTVGLRRAARSCLPGPGAAAEQSLAFVPWS
jgi:hypothetical protein